MTFREQYERETGKCHFDYPNITRTSCTWDYVQWLEAKLAQKPEVSEDALKEARIIAYDSGYKDGMDDYEIFNR